MMIEVMKSKIHCARVTEANLNYMGSITIDEDLMDAANLIAGEKVSIVNNNNGERFETYIIKGERGSGCICLNGAAARKVQVGDIVIIMSYALLDFEEAKTFKPWVIFPDSATNKLFLFFLILVNNEKTVSKTDTVFFVLFNIIRIFVYLCLNFNVLFIKSRWYEEISLLFDGYCRAYGM